MTAARGATPGPGAGPGAPGPQGVPSALAVVRAVQLRGRAAPGVLAEMLACTARDVDRALRDVPDGMVAQTPAGLAVTDAARRWLLAALEAERGSVDDAAADRLYRSFMPVDAEVKAVVTSWQLRERGGSTLVNDHSDPAYDRRVVRELARVHTRALVLAETAQRLVGRLAPFPVRLDRAHRAVAGGDHRLIAAPMADSYHTVWFELHEELLHLAGRRRADETR